MKYRRLRVYGVLDENGAGGELPGQELERWARHLREMLRVQVEVLGWRPDFSEVPSSTDVLFFDFGGVTGGYGRNPFRDRCNEARAWAEDHPSAVLVVASSFTYERGFLQAAWERLSGVPAPHQPANLLPLHDWRAPWGTNAELKAVAQWLGVEWPA